MGRESGTRTPPFYPSFPPHSFHLPLSPPSLTPSPPHSWTFYFLGPLCPSLAPTRYASRETGCGEMGCPSMRGREKIERETGGEGGREGVYGGLEIVQGKKKGDMGGGERVSNSVPLHPHQTPPLFLPRDAKQPNQGGVGIYVGIHMRSRSGWGWGMMGFFFLREIEVCGMNRGRFSNLFPDNCLPLFNHRLPFFLLPFPRAKPPLRSPTKILICRYTLSTILCRQLGCSLGPEKRESWGCSWWGCWSWVGRKGEKEGVFCGLRSMIL